MKEELQKQKKALKREIERRNLNVLEFSFIHARTHWPSFCHAEAVSPFIRIKQ